MAVVLDTHAAIWYFSNSNQLSATALSAIEGAATSAEDIFLSAISLVEVIYLAEKGKLPVDAVKRLDDALSREDSSVVVVPLDAAVAATLTKIPRSAVPDMPDRIIAATAVHLGLPLVTRDRRIQLAGINTIWYDIGISSKCRENSYWAPPGLASEGGRPPFLTSQSHPHSLSFPPGSASLGLQSGVGVCRP